VEDYAAAIASLLDAARGLPKSAEVRFFLGSALGVSGNIPEAIPELRTAMQLDPKFQPAFRAFGMFRVQQQQYSKEALQALEAAVRLDPKDVRALYWLGEFHRALGDTALARRHFESAFTLDSADPTVWLGLGRVLLDDGETDTALAHFDDVLRLEPRLVPALLGRARALYYKGQAEQALAPAEAAHTNARGFEDERGAIWILCRIYRALGRDAEAQNAEHQLSVLESTFAGEMERIRDLSERAAVFEASGNLSKVVELLEAYRRIRETDEILVRLGDAYFGMRRLADAERCYLRASQIGSLTPALEQRLRRVREAAPRDPR
jgi:tetratricopeptide (TPR) repeat protein